MRMIRQVGWTTASSYGWLLDIQSERAWLDRFNSVPGPPEWVAENRGRKLLLAYAHMLQGENDEARRLMQEALNSAHLRGVLTFMDGNWEEALPIQSQGLAWAKERDFRNDVLIRSRDVAETLRMLGRVSGAGPVLREAISIASEAPVVPEELQLRVQLAMLAVEQGPLDEARANLERCREILHNGEDWRGLVGFAETAEGVFAAAIGKSQESNLHFQRALDVTRTFRMRWHETGVLIRWGWKLTLEGQLASAKEKFAEADEVFGQMNVAPRFLQRLVRPNDLGRIDSERSSSTAAIFRRDGDYWTIAFNGGQVRIKQNAGRVNFGRCICRQERAQQLNPWPIDWRAITVPASPPQKAYPTALRVGANLISKPRLADPCLPADEAHRTSSAGSGVDRGTQFGEFAFASDERVHRLPGRSSGGNSRMDRPSDRRTLPRRDRTALSRSDHRKRVRNCTARSGVAQACR